MDEVVRKGRVVEFHLDPAEDEDGRKFLYIRTDKDELFRKDMNAPRRERKWQRVLLPALGAN